MKHLDEFKNFRKDLLVEMATISDPSDGIPFRISVYGGNSYGTGRNEHGEPHFQVFKKGELDIRVHIPKTYTEDLFVLDNTELPKQIRKKLSVWFKEKNTEFTKDTNLQTVQHQWNILNKENMNVKKVKVIPDNEENS